VGEEPKTAEGSKQVTDTTTATDKPPTDPRPACSVCGSRDHTTGYHENGGGDTGSQPNGYHEN
jgi:hypothetical protein